MSDLESKLARRLEELREQKLWRQLRVVSSPQSPRITVDGQELINFSSNDYLGLATHPAVKAAAAEALERFGTGSGASRLISGSLAPHRELEDALAHFKGAEAALSFSSGYATALGTVTALVSKGDILILDKLVHASIIDAARLSGATLRVFRHNDLNSLEEILQWASAHRSADQNVLVVTESLFSMDGDIAPLREIVNLKDKHDAWLMVDEAHATGLFGPARRGLAEEFSMSNRIDVQMGTLGKALGSAGGFIAGSRTLVEYLVNKARSFIFSTAPPPSASAAAHAAVRLVSSDEGADLLRRLRANIERFRRGVCAEGGPHSPILPVLIGPEEHALHVADQLRTAGIYVPAIRYPTVARGKARLRFTLSSTHTDAAIDFSSTLLAKTIGI